MTTVIDRIIHDHQHIARLLNCLDFEVAGYREDTGHTANLSIILEALDYLHNYPDAFHHPLESRLMVRLRPRLNKREDRVQFDLIEDQHKQINALTQKLINDFNAIASDHVVPVNLLLSEYNLYSELQRDHMDIENKYMIPAMQEYLTTDDLALVEDDLRQMSDPLFGSHLWEAYQDLYNYVVEWEAEKKNGLTPALV